MATCCENCFANDFLLELIRENNQTRNCDFCGSKEVFCIEVQEIADELEPLLSLYKPVEEFMSLEEMKYGYHRELNFLWEELNYKWILFGDELLIAEKEKELTENLILELGINEQLLHSLVMVESDYYGEGELISEVLEKQWGLISNEIKYHNRFFLNSEKSEELLTSLVDLFPFLTIYYEKGQFFFRARTRQKKEEIRLCEMGVPPLEKRKPGRANPFPIAFLYLASDELTAISEIRPNLGEKVSVGKFILQKSISILNLSKLKPPFEWGWDIDIYYKYAKFLLLLGDELSKPIAPYEEEIEYIPTQYFCEFVKFKGLDGIKYRSMRRKGNNFVIFSEDYFECSEVNNYEITNIQYEYK